MKMAIDISSYSSILRNTLDTGTNSPSSTMNTNSTSFADYFLNATSTNNMAANNNSLFPELPSFGTTSALESPLGGSSTTNNDILTSYLTDFSTNSAVNGSATTDTFLNFLQSNFQAQQMQMLTAANENLQTQATALEGSIPETSSNSAKLQLEQMTQNVDLLSNFMMNKAAETSMNLSLMAQLSSSSALTQFLTNKNNLSL